MRPGNAQASAAAATPQVPGLQVRGLACRRGGIRLFAPVDFHLAAGELLFVRGRNGRGKTTLLRAICGLTEPASGEIRFHGDSIRTMDDARRIALLYIGHRDALKEELTPLENLQMHLGLRAVGNIDEDHLLDALEAAGLGERVDTPVRYLSQGQRRRTALARLLVSQATLWVLDEPLTALDTDAVAWMAERINGHLEDGGMVICTSHQPIQGLHRARTLDLG